MAGKAMQIWFAGVEAELLDIFKILEQDKSLYQGLGEDFGFEDCMSGPKFSASADVCGILGQR